MLRSSSGSSASDGSSLANSDAFLLCRKAAVNGPVFNHNGIGYFVVQSLSSMVELHPQESCAARREAERIAECAQAGLPHCHALSGVGINNPEMQCPFPR
jgi:hypothetical protein